MAYSNGESDALDVLQTCTGFDSSNTSQTDWKILNSGKSDHYGILRPGAFEIEWITFNKYQAHWNTVIEIWQRYTVEGDSQTNLYGYVANVIAGFLPERLLGGSTSSISNADISGADAPQEMWNTAGGLEWLRWALNLAWSEEVQITFTD